MPEHSGRITSLFPRFEEWGYVEDKKPIRVKYNTEGEIVQFFLERDLYDSLLPIVGFLTNNWLELELSNTTVTKLFQEFLPEISVEYNVGVFAFTIHCVALVMHIVQRASSIRKFTYRSVGFGEGPFGKSPFGGGLVTVQYPTTT